MPDIYGIDTRCHKLKIQHMNNKYLGVAIWSKTDIHSIISKKEIYLSFKKTFIKAKEQENYTEKMHL